MMIVRITAHTITTPAHTRESTSDACAASPALCWMTMSPLTASSTAPTRATRCLVPASRKRMVASALSSWPRMSMITPSPNAGCSTSSPTRRPISCELDGDGCLARCPAARAASTTRSRCRSASPLSSGSTRRYGGGFDHVVAGPVALATVRAAPADRTDLFDQLSRDLVDEPRQAGCSWCCRTTACSRRAPGTASAERG